MSLVCRSQGQADADIQHLRVKADSMAWTQLSFYVFRVRADLKVKVVGEEEEDFGGTDGDVGVQQVGPHLNGIPLPKQIGINLLLALGPAGLAMLHIAQ